MSIRVVPENPQHLGILEYIYSLSIPPFIAIFVFALLTMAPILKLVNNFQNKIIEYFISHEKGQMVKIQKSTKGKKAKSYKAIIEYYKCKECPKIG